LGRTVIRPGLTDREFDGVEHRFGFCFAGDHRASLAEGLPVWTDDDDDPDKDHRSVLPAQRVLGASILPARVLHPTDEQSVERAFGGIRSLLFEHLLGYTGVDVADRGADPEADAGVVGVPRSRSWRR
jgi:hypothetical protein